ncbi:MAG: tetratricopeptide repeat protein, partial [bacterium]|nr:tetratricopeptide repeat protein [bacterium]
APAMEHYEKSLRIKEEIGDRRGQAYSRNSIGNIHYARGDYALALEHLTRSLDIQKEMGFKTIRCETMCEIAKARIHLVRSAVSARHSAFRHAGVADSPQVGQLSQAPALSRAEAKEDIAEGLAISKELKSVADEARCHTAYGLLYSESREFGQAGEHYEKAINLYAELKQKNELAHACLDYGKMLKASGDNERAREKLAKAKALFGEMKLDYWAGKADQELVK